MKSRLMLAVATAALLAGAGCNLNPERAKRRYLENGNKYAEQGKLREASIMYRNAIKRDPKFGEAYHKLGDTELRRGEVRQAVAAYRRAAELMPENEDPSGRLADIFLMAYSATRAARNKEWLTEVADVANGLLSRNPNSFHGMRLKGFLAVTENQAEEAIGWFRKADAVKPRQPELRFALANVLALNKQWPEAEKLLREVIADTPQYTASYDALVAHYMRNQEPQKAEEILALKVKNLPDPVDFKIQQAGFFHATKREAQARAILDGLVHTANPKPDARMKVGEFYFRIRDFESARKLFEEGIQKDPGQKSQYRNRLAMLHVSQGKTQEALAIAEQGLKEDAANPDLLQMRAALQLQTGDPAMTKQAVGDLQSLISKQPDNHVVRFNLARAYQRQGELKAAVVQYQEAVKQPGFLAARLGLAQALLMQGEFGPALQSAEQALLIDPANLQARVMKVNALINSGNQEQARNELKRYLGETPDAPDLRFQNAVLQFINKDYKPAETEFRALRERFPDDPRLVYAISEIYLATGRQKEALKFVMDEVARKPRPELRFAAGNVALRAGDLAAAEREFNHLLEQNPKSMDLHLRLGEILRLKGDTQASIALLKKAHAMQPNHIGVNMQLGLTLDSAGMKRESIPYYENTLKAGGDNPVALNNVAFMYAEEGRELDLALTYAQKARQRLPDNADVADTLGWVYLKKNLTDNALVIFRELVQKQPANATYQYHLGAALLQKGDRAGAKQRLQAALGLKPNKDDEARIRELLAKLG
jgi:tetratricopeptide (TPR) repeat protein